MQMMINLREIFTSCDKSLKFYSCSHKKHAKRSHLQVCRDSWSFTCSSKTVHYHTELARWL